MGHADIATTMVYVHHVPQVDAADRLSQVVAGAQSSTMLAAATDMAGAARNRSGSRD